MHCIYCGQQNPDTAKVCGFCGQQLRTSDPSVLKDDGGYETAVCKQRDAASVIKIVAWVLMGLGAAYVPLTSMLGVHYTIRLFYYMPFVIVALMFLAWKRPVIAAGLLLAPTFRFFYFFLYSGPLLLASLLLIASGALTGRRQQ